MRRTVAALAARVQGHGEHVLVGDGGAADGLAAGAIRQSGWARRKIWMRVSAGYGGISA
jgi:hypothetical protein